MSRKRRSWTELTRALNPERRHGKHPCELLCPHPGGGGMRAWGQCCRDRSWDQGPGEGEKALAELIIPLLAETLLQIITTVPRAVSLTHMHTHTHTHLLFSDPDRKNPPCVTPRAQHLLAASPEVTNRSHRSTAQPSSSLTTGQHSSLACLSNGRLDRYTKGSPQQALPCSGMPTF